MGISVNFLPWRQGREKRRRRRWVLITALLTLTAILGGGIAVEGWRSRGTVISANLDAERLLAQALKQREMQLTRRQQSHTTRRYHDAIRRSTLAWQTRLTDLAAALPAQAWLTRLDYQNGVLALSGSLSRFSALHPLNDMLQHIDEFQPAVAGKMARDEKGRWLFNYTLKRNIADAAP